MASSPESPPLPDPTKSERRLSQELRRLSPQKPTDTKVSPSPTFNYASPGTRSHMWEHTQSSPIRPSSNTFIPGKDSPLGLGRQSSSPIQAMRASLSPLQSVGANSERPATSRTPSSTNMPNSPLVKSPLGGIEDDIPKRIFPTAADIAKLHFQAELDVHESDTEYIRATRTVVVLQDTCYGHRFSRPRTTKSGLATIVERPERILASILGISAAYVLLGRRHSGGNYGPHPKQDPRLLPSIPFRIVKSTKSVSLSSHIITNVHGVKWMEELKMMCEAAESRLALSGKELARPDVGGTAAEQAQKPKLHEGDLYLCAESLAALEGCIGAVCDGVDRVFSNSPGLDGARRAFVCIRPPGHHCSSSHPSGFCWLNNVHVGISYAASAHGLTHAAIIDFDLHHGDGSQSIAWAHNARVARLPKNAPNSKRTAIGYFSLHDINSYPCEMGDEEKVQNASLCIENAHGQTIWNVHLQPWKTYAEFWQLYEGRYKILLEKARAFLLSHSSRLRAASNSAPPRAAIFLSSGFDASEWESAGMQRHKVNVPTDFYARFTSDVIKIAEEADLGVDGRIISVLEGGYSDRALCSGVLSHLSGLAGEDSSTIIDESMAESGLGYEMGARLGALSLDEKNSNSKTNSMMAFDPDWWSQSHLEELESAMNPPPPPTAPKRPQPTGAPTYTSPTQSFTAKIVMPPNPNRRTSSGVSAGSPRTVSRTTSRAPSPPPPQVNWITATVELHKILIPTDRQTLSCRPEELNAEASRVRRERHSTIGVPENGSAVSEPKRMNLRDRKGKNPNYSPVMESENKERAISRSERRKTVGGDVLINNRETNKYRGSGARQTRRLSVASSVGSTNGENSFSKSKVSAEPNAGLEPEPTLSQPAAHSDPMRQRTNNAVTVKKTRTVSARKPDTSKQILSKTSPPVPHIPSAYRSQNESTTVYVPPVETVSQISTAGSSADVYDIDNLTSGLKRIKINVPPKEDYEARNRNQNIEGKNTEKKPPAKSSKKSTAVKVPRSNGGRKASPKVATSPSMTGIASSAGDITTHAPELTSSAINAAAPDTSRTLLSGPPDPIPLVKPNQVLPSQPTAQPAPALEFLPYNPPQPIPNPIVKQESLHWLPPNSATPPQYRRERGELPAFTSSSAIPFGISAAQVGSQGVATNQGSSQIVPKNEPTEQAQKMASEISGGSMTSQD